MRGRFRKNLLMEKVLRALATVPQLCYQLLAPIICSPILQHYYR